MKTSVVLGLLFGDEGKGLTTSNLARGGDLVVRFNGGCQAGHTVEKNGYRHIFSSFGSGTLNGADTYWSQFCAFYPKSFFNERKALLEQRISPGFYIHPLAPVITPFDIDHNRGLEEVNKHGSVGMGFGSTIERTENTPYKLFAVDLTFPKMLEHKLRQIAKYYKVENPEEDIKEFMFYVNNINLDIASLSEIKAYYGNIVFEGAQGIMLDMDHGFFPHVTRSYTTSRNAMQIIEQEGLPSPDIYYVMRSYLTRHGNGWMPNEDASMSFEDKTNVSHKYQGNLRQGKHSFQMLEYALNCDKGYSSSKRNLVITCLNQTNGKVLVDGMSYYPKDLAIDLSISSLYTSENKTEINGSTLHSLPVFD